MVMNQEEISGLSRPVVASLLDAWSMPAALLAPDYRVLAANTAYRETYGVADPRGRHCYELSHHFGAPCHLCGADCPVQHSAATGQPSRTVHVHHTSRGEEHEEVRIVPVRGEGGAVVAFLELLHPLASATLEPPPSRLVGRSPAFNHMLDLGSRVAPTDTAVLLLGETGTGKEVMAQVIHERSRRARGAFVPVDCSGLTESLFESELFGHEKGAFTGAAYRKKGLVEAAEGGTLFLDEVGDIPLSLQVKLLRLLETGTFRRVGSPEQRRADFRLICATHRDLDAMVASGAFRADLYYRISVFPVPLPPLRERREDIPAMAEAMLHRVSPERRLELAPETLRLLAAYSFPGNARELLNLLERAALLTEGPRILPEHLPAACQGGGAEEPEPREIVPLAEAERRYLRWAATRHGGDRSQLARRLGLSERTLYRKLRESQEVTLHSRAGGGEGRTG